MRVWELKTRGLVVLCLGAAAAILAWSAFSGGGLEEEIGSVVQGEAKALDVLGAGGEGLGLKTVLVSIRPEAEKAVALGLSYLFAPERPGRPHCWVRLDNVERRIEVEWGGSGDRMLESFPADSLDLSGLALDVEEAFEAAQGAGGKEFLQRRDHGTRQLNLVLASKQGRPVWMVAYDGWDDNGPRGFLRVEIDGIDGRVISTIRER